MLCVVERCCRLVMVVCCLMCDCCCVLSIVCTLFVVCHVLTDVLIDVLFVRR